MQNYNIFFMEKMLFYNIFNLNDLIKIHIFA